MERPIIWDHKLLERSRDKSLWVFGPVLVDGLLSEIYMIECPEAVLDILSTFLNFRYCFRTRGELIHALTKWYSQQRMKAFEAYGHISLWDMHLMTDMSRLFSNMQIFNDDISLWDTSAVTDMKYMFESAKAFNCDLSGWDTSKVTNMSWMFHHAEVFNSDIGNWDTSNVQNMTNMFCNAHAFNCDISNWDTSNVRHMNGMFCEARSFNCNIGKWDLSELKSFIKIFENADALEDKWKNKFLGSMITCERAAKRIKWSDYIDLLTS